MRTLAAALPLTMAAFLAGCDDPSPTSPAESAAVPPPSLAAEITRFDLSGGFLLHTIPPLGITFTLGLAEPVAELEECGGPPAFIRTDTRGTDLNVFLPPGPIKDAFRIQGTMVLYDAVIFDFADLCGLVSDEIGRGLATFTNNDNDLALYGGRADSFGGVITAVLDLVGGGKAKLLILTRGVVSPDGSFRQVVDRYELKRLGK
jgi:hypothetical protein